MRRYDSGVTPEQLSATIVDVLTGLVDRGEVALPDGVDDVALAETALRAGVLVSAGRRFFPAEPPGPRVRFSHGFAADEAELPEGVARFARALAVASPE